MMRAVQYATSRINANISSAIPIVRVMEEAST